jgi:hypothetical protein
MRRASAVEVLPIFSSAALIRKIGEMRICSLWRKFVEMALVSSNYFVGPTSTRRQVHPDNP